MADRGHFTLANGGQFEWIFHYSTLDDVWRKEQKLQWFTENHLKNISFEIVRPDKNNNWINMADNDFEILLPLVDKAVKSGKSKKALFGSFSLGVATNRDEWVYDFSTSNLANKIKYFSDFYNIEIERWNNSDKKEKINDFVRRDIKWTSELESHLQRQNKLKFDSKNIRIGAYRCFVNSPFYFDKIIIHRLYQNEQFFGIEKHLKNKVIALNTNGKEFNVLATDLIPNNHFNGDSQCVPFYIFDSEGNNIENLTDWGYNQFTSKYGKKGVTKETIFNYVYAVLHNPAYRKKYELNLKREFPRIPFYENFKQWADWGKQLMDLHINYETVKHHGLEVENIVVDLAAGADFEKLYKGKLKANKTDGIIEIDTFTTIKGIPKEAWEYKLGNRSALEWILDQYKEGKPKDPTIAEKFNTYRFSDYKEQVIDLLKRVCTVSVETIKIIKQMEELNP